MKRYLKENFTGWRAWELCYAAVCTAAIAGISCCLGDTFTGIVSAVSGTLYTLFAGKGKTVCYVFGIVNTVLYGYIAKSYTLYGDMMLNWLVYLPMMFTGMVLWERKLDENGSVVKTALSWCGRAVLLVSAAAGIAGYAYILHKMGDAQPVTDAATTVLSVAAMIMTLKRCIEQWVLWTLVNGLSVFMWFRVWFAGNNSVATLLWWIIMLVTGMIFFVQWYIAIRKNPPPAECREIS